MKKKLRKVLLGVFCAAWFAGMVFVGSLIQGNCAQPIELEGKFYGRGGYVYECRKNPRPVEEKDLLFGVFAVQVCVAIAGAVWLASRNARNNGR